MVCVSSDKGTVHVYKLSALETSTKKKQNVGTLTDAFSNMWDTQRDFAHAKLTKSSDMKNICGFAPSGDAVHVVTFDGFVHRFSFSKEIGGEAKLDYCKSIFDISLESADDDEVTKK
jgi:hypothetical protein